jgi:hypothetical protein
LKGFFMDDIKKMIKIADKVLEALIKLRASRYFELVSHMEAIANNYKDIIAQSKKLSICLIKGWFAAVEECCYGVNRLADEVSYSISRVKQFAEKPQEELTTLSAIVDELMQLQQEFVKFEYDKKSNAISVITKPITLEDVYLGPFKIQLELNKLADLYKNAPYSCIALDPHPASTAEDVTHPHVSGDKLCEGEGYAAIKSALEHGRLCDFFTLIRSILNTYSPDSPYVSLADWEGTACYECGYIMDSENSYYCESCENTFCEECTTCCSCCDETVCLGCLESCSYCEEKVCPNCISKCADCGSLCCKSCLDEDVCPNCKEELEAENEKRENGSEGTNENTDTTEPTESTKPEIKLAG